MRTRNLTYTIGSICLAFSAAWVSAYFLRSETSGLTALHIYISSLMMTSNLAMLRYLVPRQKFVGARLVSTLAQKMNEVVISHVAKGGMIVFSLGAILFDMVCFLSLVDCMGVFIEEDCHWGWHLTTTIYTILKVLFMGLQMWFLFSEGYTFAKLGRSNTSKPVFIFNAIVNFTIILYTNLHVVATDAESPNCIAYLSPANSTQAFTTEQAMRFEQCITRETKLFLFRERLGPYFYPFHSEYCILAMTLNLILWKHSMNVRKSQVRKPVIVGRTYLRSRVSDSLTSDNGAEEETDALVPKQRNETPVELETTLTGNFKSIQIETRDGDADADDMDSSLSFANGYGTVENELENDGDPIRRGGVVAIFKECKQCSGCLDPRPRYIYGPDNGCGFFAFIGFALLIAYTIPVLLLKSYSPRRELFTTLYALTLIVNVMMLVAALLLAIGTSRKLDLGPKFCKNLSVGSIALLLSALVYFFYDFLFLDAAWDIAFHPPNMTEIDQDHHMEKNIAAMPLLEQNVLDIITIAADFLQVALQTNIVINNHWIMKRSCFDDVISTSTMMQCTSILMAANFCKWVVGSMVEIHQPRLNLAQSVFYGEENWKYIVYLFFPFVMYYRFHCTMAMGEYMIWRRGLLDAGRARAGRAGFVPSIGTLAY